MSGLEAAERAAQGAELGRLIAGQVKAAIEAAISPVLERIGAVELAVRTARMPGKVEEIERALEALSTRLDNAKVGLAAELEKRLDAGVEKMAASITEIVNGQASAKIEKLVDRVDALEALKVPERLELLGKTISEVEEIVQTSGVALDKRLDELASSTEGLIKTAADVPELKGDKGDKGDTGDTGASVVSALIDRKGELILTLATGQLCNVGLVVGKDGDPGFSLEDFDVELVGERELCFTFRRGEKTVERMISVPWLLDRGVYREGEAYKAGDGATWGGALWLAQRDTKAKPGTDDSWRLAVKKGRDGRDARGAGQ